MWKVTVFEPPACQCSAIVVFEVKDAHLGLHSGTLTPIQQSCSLNVLCFILCHVASSEAEDESSMPGEASSVVVKLQHFFHMPGMVVLLELGLREAYRSLRQELIMNALIQVASILLHLIETNRLETMLACVSLAATMRKLQLQVLQPGGANAQLQLQLKLQLQLRQLIPYDDDEEEDFGGLFTSWLPTMMRKYKVVIVSLTARNRLVRRKPAASTVDITQRNHQLQAVLLLSWIQLCRIPLGTTPGVVSRRWKQGLRGEVHELGSLIGDLNGLLSAAVPALSKVGINQHKLVDSAWEEYRVTYLRGQLLPGCYHQGCSNLEGISEAALPTLLCSGCKQARYCSVACQKAAWHEGGHAAVCGI